MSLGFNTNSLHSGHETDKTQGTRSSHLSINGLFFDNADHAANLFSLAEPLHLHPLEQSHQRCIGATLGGFGRGYCRRNASGTSAIIGTIESG